MQAVETPPSKLPMLWILLFNAIPLYGVLAWDWRIFDLIFLYWLENLIIGGFVLVRFVIRPFSHWIEWLLLGFLVPFFCVHYFGFCYGHGSFLLGMFGDEAVSGLANTRIPGVIWPLIEKQQLLMPVLGLVMLHLFDWVRDVREQGLGSANIKELMIAPYRRILVLHITIIVGAFVLGVLNDPLWGLVLLVVIKTVSDFYHLKKDRQLSQLDKYFELNDKLRGKIDEAIDDPKVIVNGQEIRFDSIEELRASKYYGMFKAIVRLVGGGRQLKAMDAYIKRRMLERRPG